MGRSKKFDYESVIESKLLEHPDGLTLDELLARSGLEIDRSTLFRHLARLIERGRAQRVGKARASRYLLRGHPGSEAAPALPDAQGSAVQPVPAPAPTERTPPLESAFSGWNRAPLPESDRIPAELPEQGALVKKAVRRIVREWKQCSEVNLQIYLSLLVPRDQLDGFSSVVRRELAGLHEGNLDRFELTPSEFSGFVPPESTQAQFD